MNRIKRERLEGIILRDISEILQFEVREPKIGFVTVTGVSLTADGSYAKVYVTDMGSRGDLRKSMEALEHAKGYIRSQLASRLDIRKCPELTFVADTSLENGNRIDRILEDLHQEKQP